MKGVGKIYQQTFVDTYSRVAQAKIYTEKSAITSADILNDKVLPFYLEHNIELMRILTDRGTEYCGKPEHHAYQLYLGIENIDHSKTKVPSPQTNGICERFHRTMKQEFYDIAFRKKYTIQLRNCKLMLIYGSINTILKERTQESIVMVKLLCKLFLIQNT